MNCPECQLGNREGAKFCKECGTKLELPCPQCGNTYTPGTKFCDECGQNLTFPTEPPPKELSFDEKIKKIQRYLPKGLTEKILSQRDKIEGERKQVTVLFCDLEGFTPLVEKIGPEEAYTIMDQVYELLIHKVHDYEGTVNEMTGDGIMALFGAPIALEDAPQRAIRSAYAIHKDMSRFSDRLREERKDIPALKMRIGIHSGPVVVGTLGNDLRVEFKAVGDTVNMASRMESLAEPGSTYVTEQIFRLTEGIFRFEALGELSVKGKKETFKAYRVIATSSRRTRFDVSAERGLTPFVGRKRELELLLDGYMRSKTGNGQAISIISEAGVGKSRLLYEFRKAVANDDSTFLEGKCLSFSRHVAYHPLIDILKSNFDTQDIHDDAEIKIKVSNGLKALSVDEGSVAPYLLELLSVKESGIDKIVESPEARKDRTIEALKRIVLKGSEIRPLIIAIEDLHWIDKSSEDCLEELLASIAGSRVFLIFTYRPDVVYSWGARSYHSQVSLNRLSNRESLAMIAHILGVEYFDSDLGDLVLEKTDGIPFFIEEFIRSLKDLKIIEKKDNTYYLSKTIQDITIPSTIHDVIMSRVDSLPEGTKSVLHVGSAIEREFSYQLLKSVCGIEEKELLHHLSILKGSELLYERGIYPQSTHIFKHALTRQVVYDSILATRKKQLHESIGNAIEELYQDNLIEHYGVLAEHFIDGENYEKGETYSHLAAQRARKAASYKDAINYCDKRVACLEKLNKSHEVNKKLIDARVTLGLYYNQMCYFSKAVDAVSPIVDLASKAEYKKRNSQIKAIIGTHVFGVEGNYQKGIQYLKEALKIAEEASDLATLWISNHWLGHAYAENCEFDKALYHLNKALEISKAANIVWSISIMKSCIANTLYATQGNAELSYQTSIEALGIAESSGDTMSKAEAYVHHGISCFLKGFLDEAERHLLIGEKYSKKIDYLSEFLACRYLGLIYLEKNQYHKSQEYFSESIKMMEKRESGESLICLNKINLIHVKILQRTNKNDIDIIFNYEQKNKIKALNGSIALWISQILLATEKPDIEKAEYWVQKAINADKENGQIWYLGIDFVVLAQLYKLKNKSNAAKDKLVRAIQYFNECGASGWAEKYKNELDRM